MKDRDVHSVVESERPRFINYVRSLLRDVADVDPEDVVQDVLVKTLERTDLPAPDFLAAYIFRSLRNRVIDHARTRKRMVSLDAESDDGGGKLIELLKDRKPNALEALQTQEGKEELFEALDELGDMEKEVVIGHELEGVPFKELSQLWDVPVNTLLSHKSRAMKKLRKHFLGSQGETR